MKTVQIEVFEFDELSDSAKETARAWWREASAGDDFWSECALEDAKECFALVGFSIKDVFYSGFWSQGDGACFTGTWYARDVKPGKLKKHAPQDAELHRIALELERIAVAFPDAAMRIEHREVHEMSASFEHELNAPEYSDDVARTVAEWDALAKACEPFEEALIETARDAMHWIYRTLEKEYEYQNADKQVDENIRANEYEFLENGERH